MVRRLEKKGERGAGIMLVALIILGITLMVGTFIISGKWMLDEAAYRDTQVKLRSAAYAISSTHFPNVNLKNVRHYETDIGGLPSTVQELWSQSAGLPNCALNTSANIRDARGWCGPYVAYIHSGDSLADGWGRPFIIYTSDRTIHSYGPNMKDDSNAADDVRLDF